MARPVETIPSSGTALRRAGVLLFLLLWLSYGYFYQSGGHNEAARLDAARALVEDGVPWVDPYAFNSADLVLHERDGVRHYYSGKAPGATLLMAVPLKLWSTALAVLDLPEWIHWHWVVHLTTWFTIGLLSALASVALLDIAWRSTRDAAVSLAAVVAVWLGSIVFPFSTLAFGHVLAASLLAFAFAILFRLRNLGVGGFERPRVVLSGAGFFAGYALVTEYPTAIPVALLGTYFLYTLWHLAEPRRVRWQLLGCFVLGGGIAGAILATYNLLVFGELAYVSYQAYLEGQEAALFPAHTRGFLGVAWPGLARFFDVLAEISVRPQRGLLYVGVEAGRLYALSPVLWLAAPGLLLLGLRRETRPEAVLVAALIICLSTFNACFGDSIVYWGGGASVGPRHLIPMLPFLALPIAWTVRRAWWLFTPLLAVSVFYNLIATAIEPRVGYEFANPARDLFWPSYEAGHFALTRSGLFDPLHRLLTEDSTAFNLGKLWGLPGAWQLAPLMAVWVVLGSLLIRTAHRRDAAAPSAWSPALGVGLLATFGLSVVALPSLLAEQPVLRSGDAGLVGRYYANADWQGEPERRQLDAPIDYDWSEPPWPLPPPFSIEWSGFLHIEQPGTHVFVLESDDGSVLEIDGQVVVDNGGAHAVREREGSIELSAGKHPLRLRYFNQLLGGRMRLLWQPVGGTRQRVPPRVLSPTLEETTRELPERLRRAG